MLIRIIIAIILGLIAAWIAGLFLPHTIAALIGLAVGLLYFFAPTSWPQRPL